MKRRIWKKACEAENVKDFIIEKTGKTVNEITAVTGKTFKRFEEVKSLLLEAAKTGRMIFLVGDYDSDGINSVNIMALLFRILGIKFSLIIPKREAEGYGLSMSIINRIPDGVILITIDNGITAVEQMKEAKRRGMTTVILDHHEAPYDENRKPIVPDVDILIDPSAIGEADYTHYCGGGIAYRLSEYVLGENHPIIKTMSAFAAIATIGDVVELSGDNRQIVIEGMNAMANGYGTNALKHLLGESKISANSTATDFAFYVVPALNAPERLEDGGAQKVCSVLLKNNNYEDGVNWLMETNSTRKQIVKTVLETIDIDGYRKSKDAVIVLADKNIPMGIAGIIAGKLSESTGKPSFVFGYHPNGTLKGSARCDVKGVNLIEKIRLHSDLLIQCGGHAGAAGLAIEEKNLDAFRQAMNECMSQTEFDENECMSQTEFDGNEYTFWDIEANDLTIHGVSDQILALEPCGEGMPAPKVRIKSRLKSVSFFGGTKDTPDNEKPHVKFEFAGFTAIGFNMNGWYQEQKALCGNARFADIVGTVTDNVYKGVHSIQIRMDDFELE